MRCGKRTTSHFCKLLEIAHPLSLRGIHIKIKKTNPRTHWFS